MKRLVILSLLFVQVIAFSSRHCHWSSYINVYNQVINLIVLNNNICDGFSMIGNRDYYVDNVTNYCITYSTNNVRNKLPPAYNGNGGYCKFDDLHLIKYLKNVMYQSYLSPLCTLIDSAHNETIQMNYTEQLHVNNSKRICDVVSSYALGDTISPGMIVIVVFASIIAGFLVVSIIAPWIDRCCNKSESVQIS